MIAGKSIQQWFNTHPLIQKLVSLEEIAWFNPNIAPTEIALTDVGLTQADVDDASQRLARFAPFICRVFPQTVPSQGIIESPLQAIPEFQKNYAQRMQQELIGNLWIKLDSHLPISGSIKARGGIYEVLKHAETLAIQAGLLSTDDDYAKLDSVITSYSIHYTKLYDLPDIEPFLVTVPSKPSRSSIYHNQIRQQCRAFRLVQPEYRHLVPHVTCPLVLVSRLAGFVHLLNNSCLSPASYERSPGAFISRKPSPTKLIARTSTINAIPGIAITHG